jgi:hypothetical protein
MRSFVLPIAVALLSACATNTVGQQPSLAPRAAEVIDPRLPIPAEGPTAPADAALVATLAGLVGEARSGTSQFEVRRANAEQLAAAAGPMPSESWVAAQQALSLLIEQHGLTTRIAANIDELASNRVQGQRWIRPADQQAIASAALEVGAINDAQAGVIDRLKDQLSR